MSAALLPLLFSQLQPGQIIVTVNRRLSIYLQEEYARYQIASGKTVWPTLDVIPYQDWLIRCYEAALDQALIPPELLLNEQQELSVWEHIITHSQSDKPLMQRQATALNAKKAWQILCEWQCPLDHPSFAYSEDTSVFQEWAKIFTARLAENQWLELSRLPTRLYTLFAVHQSLLPKAMVWAGFIEYTPQQIKLRERLNSIGCLQTNWQAARPATNTIQQIMCTNQAEEIRLMARWAKKLAEDPNQRIGCIIPNLAELRAEVVRTFTEIFAPDALLDPAHLPSKLPFTLASGQPLTAYSLIHAALLALQLNQPQVPTAILDYLLRSPYFGQPTEWFIQIRLQASLRQYNEHALSHQQIIRWIEQQTLSCAWLDNLANLLKAFTQLPSQQSPTAWIISFNQQLALLGWPGKRGLSTEEYQLLQKWQELLTVFASLDTIYPSISAAKAWQKLQYLAATTLFQPKTEPNVIPIFSPLEAVGQHFTHLWIMSANDSQLPSQPNPVPFLPFALQRAYQIPHVDAVCETQFCEKLLAHYYELSPLVIFSYAQQHSEHALRPSQLISHLPHVENLALAPDVQLAQQIYNQAALECIDIMPAPPITDPSSIRGGASIFKSQAACAFKAFAEFRLGAKTPETLELGLAATERGNVLHQALEYLWREIKTHQRLLELSEIECTTLIQQAIHTALLKLKQRRQGTITQRIIALESQRLTKLLTAWLALEKQRPPFQVVALERAAQVSVGGIPLTLKLDRLDQLVTGEYVIIDYKTGKVQAEWESEYLNEPQLPLYCISSPYPIAAAILAQIRADEIKFHGLAQADGLIPTVKAHTDWQGLQTKWQHTLNQLAEQFLKGYAAIAPKDQKTCERCNLALVCRIKEKI